MGTVKLNRNYMGGTTIGNLTGHHACGFGPTTTTSPGLSSALKCIFRSKGAGYLLLWAHKIHQYISKLL